MQKFSFDIHYDMVIQDVEVMAETLEEARQMAYDKAARLPMESMECVGKDACLNDTQKLTERETRRMENEEVMKFISEYVEQQTPTEVHDIAEGYGVNWLEWVDDENETAFYNGLFRAISSSEHPRTNVFERYARLYARHRWQEVADSQAEAWDRAFAKARRGPETYRVIVETNEREEETGDGDRYFMIDRWEPLSGTMLERWHVIRCDCAASPYDTRTAKAYTVGTETQPSCEASPANVTRWARLMIDAGRVVSIYADCY